MIKICKTDLPSNSYPAPITKTLCFVYKIL